MLFTVFTIARHLGSYPQPNESNTCPHIPFLKQPLPTILPTTPSLQMIFSGFSNQTPYAGFMSPHAIYISRQTHPPNADHPYNSGEEYELWSPTLRSFLHPPITPSPLRFKHPPLQYPFSFPI